MRFAVRQWLILFALVSLMGAAVFGQQTSAPPAERRPSTQQDQKDQKDGTGVVPPRRETRAADAGFGRSDAISFSFCSHKDSSQRVESFCCQRPP